MQNRLWQVAAGPDSGWKATQCALFGYWPPVTASYFPSVQQKMARINPLIQSSRLKDHAPALWNLGYELLGPLKQRIDSGDAKPGRNDPCPCGSGAKLKKCHGR
jgi:hypothetical protein